MQKVVDNTYIRIVQQEFDTVRVECHTSKEELVEDLSQLAYGIKQSLFLKTSDVGLFFNRETSDVEIIYDIHGNVYILHNHDEEELLEFICTIIQNFEKKKPVLH